MAPICKTCHWCPTSHPRRCRHQMQEDQAGYLIHKCTRFIFLSWCRVLSCLWVSSLGPAAPGPPYCTFLAPNSSSTLTCWNLTAKALRKDPLCPIILSGCFVSQEYGPCTFWLNMLDAAFQSLVCFFIPYLVSLAVGPACPIHPQRGPPPQESAVFQAYYDSDTDLFAWGTPITAIALFTFLLHLGIETKTWVRAHSGWSWQNLEDCRGWSSNTNLTGRQDAED